MDGVTRAALAQLLEGAFHDGPVGRDQLIEAARANGASTGDVATLGRLARPQYRELRDLWTELHDIPIGSPRLVQSS